MGLETATYIHELVSSNPEQEDLRRQGDDHLRTMKTALLNTFPNITGPVQATQAELNLLVGATALPSVEIVTLNVDFSTELAAGESRVYTLAAAGVVASASVIPLPGAPYSSFPALLFTSCRALAGQIEFVIFNAGSNAVPQGTELSTPFAVLT